MFRRGLRFGVGAAIEHAAVIGRLPLATVVDIGANVGQFSLLVAGLHPDARVYAFEPQSVAAKRFEQVFAGYPNVVLHRQAVGQKEERLSLQVSKRNDSSSLLVPAPLLAETFPGTTVVATEVVEVVPLSRVLSPEQIQGPALLKLDVQGYELHALEGCESLMPLFSYVYLEMSFALLYEGQASPSQLWAHLDQRGFSLQGVYNTTYDREGIAVQCDCFFARAANALITHER